jgi:hypothetical protein
MVQNHIFIEKFHQISPKKHTLKGIVILTFSLRFLLCVQFVHCSMAMNLLIIMILAIDLILEAHDFVKHIIVLC